MCVSSTTGRRCARRMWSSRTTASRPRPMASPTKSRAQSSSINGIPTSTSTTRAATSWTRAARPLPSTDSMPCAMTPSPAVASPTARPCCRARRFPSPSTRTAVSMPTGKWCASATPACSPRRWKRRGAVGPPSITTNSGWSKRALPGGPVLAARKRPTGPWWTARKSLSWWGPRGRRFTATSTAG
ncbi:hypothetical protein D3C84_910740 [compost metagenome]